MLKYMLRILNMLGVVQNLELLGVVSMTGLQAEEPAHKLTS